MTSCTNEADLHDHANGLSDRGEVSDAVTRVPSMNMTSFIGRSALLTYTSGLLAEVRVVTLTGSGGVGKTRLLEKLTVDAMGHFDEVVVVPLSGLKASEDRLASTIAGELKLLDNSSRPATARLIDHLSTRGKMLLALDNCEHLVGVGPGTGQVPRLLGALLPAVPRLYVVASSREPLGVPGEHVVPVPPLSVVKNDPACAEGCSCCVSEALQLLLDRARAAGTGIDPSDYDTANQLCALLDGIPLNLELAAVQLDTMTLHEMVEQRRDLLDTLVGGNTAQRHHRSVRDTLDWSYRLLGEPLRRMWALVSVFEGGFDLQAATAVCHDMGVVRGEVRTLLGELKKRSLLVVDQRGGSTRFRVAETIRQYGEELVVKSGESVRLRQAHADYYDSLVTQAADEWLGPNELSWMERVHAEQLNIRAAQQFFLSDSDQKLRALRLALNAGRSRSYIFAGFLNEGRRMLSDGLDQHPDDPSLDQVAGLSLAAWFALIQGNQVRAKPLLEQAVAAARVLGCHETFPPLLYALATRQWLAESDTALARLAIEAYRRTEQAFREAGADGDALMAVMFGAMAAAFLADRDTAFAEAGRLLDASEKVGAVWSISWGLWTSALAELLHGDPNKALHLALQTLRIQDEIGDTWGPAWTKWLLFVIAIALGEHELGARLMGGANAARKLTNTSVLGLLPWLSHQQKAEAQARSELGDEEFEILVAMGEQLSHQEVVRLAFTLKPRVLPSTHQQSAGLSQVGLSATESRVARLVAGGMSNREIAEAMGGISHRTVEVHVYNISRKLTSAYPGMDFGKRRQIGIWYAQLPDDELATDEASS